MKKILSVLIVLIMIASCMTIFASAAENGLPFELVAPANVSAKWLEGNDSPTTTAISYSLSNEMTDFFKQLEEAHANDTFADFMSKYGYDDLNMTTQVDWAVDNVDDEVSGWHCNEFWSADYGFGYDSDYRIRVGEWDGVDLGIGNATETVNNHWVTRYVSEDAFNGNPEEGRIGLKDQLRPEQYEYKYNDGEGSLFIDYTQHTVYFRMRFVLTTYKDTEEGPVLTHYYSDWSNIASVGKDAEKFVPLTSEDIAAPVITDLRMTDKEFNGNPVVAFTLTVPDKLAEDLTKVTASGGGIFIDTYARVKGDEEWTLMSNTDWNISAGERECALITLVNGERPSIPKDTEIELRCRYRCTQPELDDVYSEYSNTITFGTNDISVGGETVADTEALTDAPEAVQPAEDKCPICHFCPRPLGLCIFIWIAIILVVIIIIIIIIANAKKKKDKK